MYHIRYWSNGSQFNPPLSSHSTIEAAEEAVQCNGDDIYDDNDNIVRRGRDVINERRA